MGAYGGQAGLSFRNYGEAEVLECCASQDRRADAWRRRHVSECTCRVAAPIAGRAANLANLSFVLGRKRALSSSGCLSLGPSAPRLPPRLPRPNPKVEPGVTTQVAVKIRLKRMGKIRAPYYRVVVVDSRKKRDGRVIEEIGKYHPTENPSLIEIDSDRVQYWLSVGAQPTDPVLAQLKVTGDWQKFKGLPGAEGRLKVKESVDVEGARKAAVESVQNEAEKRRAAAAEAKIAAEAAAAAESVEEAAEEA